MKKLIIFLILSTFLVTLVADKIDLNQANLKEIKKLPLTNKQAEDIYNYRLYISNFKSIYQLREIPSIDQKTLLKLKPLVRISHYIERDEVAKRRDDIYYLIQRLGSNEGFQEGMSDIWEDYLLTPQNINRMTFSDILSMPNVSPIDAAAILIRKAGGDTLSSYRDLRKTPMISHYGATNLRHYIYYREKIAKNKLYFDYQMKYNGNVYSDEVQDMFKESLVIYGDNEIPEKEKTFWGFFDMEGSYPSVMNKIRFRFNNQWKSGIMFYNQKGEKDIFSNNTEKILKNSKYFAGYENFIGKNNFIKVYLGNYRATFGEGLVMENTDFSGARKTGQGFSKRVTGIIGDISRTQEYSLKGGAVEFKNPFIQGALFFSHDKKDAVMYNSNSILEMAGNDTLLYNELAEFYQTDKEYVLSYVTPSRRFSDAELSDIQEFTGRNFKLYPKLDALDERIIGGHMEYSPLIGTHLGMTFYEAVYDKDILIPEEEIFKKLLIRDEDDFDKFKMMDNEILAGYSTKTDDYDRNYRRVLGFDWQTVLHNTSFQGEYAELSVNGKISTLGDDPHALIISNYTQFSDLYFITLYRDYDLEFDNPYSTAFYEHERFDDTIYDKNFYVTDNPLLADIFINSERAQAEKGIYFETRYRFNRYLTINRTYLDIWERKADGRRSVRFQGELDFRPVYQISLRGKYKHQQNRYHDDADRGVSISDETTAKISTYISNFDRISIEYRYNRVKMNPYPYLSNDAEPHDAGDYDGDLIATGTNLIHGDYIGADYTHNFNANLKLQGSIIFWDGHGVSHWDWEDMEIDFMGEQGMKYWFSIHSKISGNIFLSLKYKVKQYKTKENQWRTWWNTNPEDENNGYITQGTYFDTVNKKENTIRLQLDWKF